MSFLAPWFLALAAAAIVPLLIHLLRRRIGLRVDFPAARYLARAEREHSRTLRMRNLLLMLLRVAAVLLLASAAARPTARMAGAGHAPTALAVVLDNSMSTSVIEDGAPLLDRFKAMTRSALAEASPDDRLWLVTADGAVRAGNAALLLDELDRVRSHAGAGDMREALARGIAAVQSSGMPAKQVALLTDAQRATWTEPTHSNGDVPVLIWAPTHEPPVNRAVTFAEPRPPRWTPRGVLATRVAGPDSTSYRMALGGRTVARGSIGPGDEALVRAAPAERGWTAGTVEIQPDELALDNTRHFALWIGPPTAVRVHPGAGLFVRNAVDVLRANERVTESASAAVAVAPADETTALPALILPPSDPVRLGAANRSLERLGVPWRFGAAKRESAVARGEGIEVNVSMRYELLPRGVPDAETLAVVGRWPWMVGGSRYVLVGSPIHPNATDLPISAAFLPWIGEVLSSRLHADPGSVRSARPGERVARPTGVEALESTAGARIALSGRSIEAPGAAGTYFFVRGGRRVGALVVNSEAAESRLQRWSSGGGGDFASRIVSAGGRVARDPGDWVAQAFSGAGRRSLVIPLLVALAAVLVIEAIVATLESRRRAAAAPAAAAS